jgi:hypothetical protein
LWKKGDGGEPDGSMGREAAMERGKEGVATTWAMEWRRQREGRGVRQRREQERVNLKTRKIIVPTKIELWNATTSYRGVASWRPYKAVAQS